jgi:hypothetical protein
MKTIPLDLDGYTDLPAGKIANVVTYLEMVAPPDVPRIERPDLSVRRMASPDLAWYRSLYGRIGVQWLWFSRVVMPEDRLHALLADPSTEIHVLERHGEPLGFAELSRAVPGEVEVAMFGVVPEATGTGAARLRMETALASAWTASVRRVWLHT